MGLIHATCSQTCLRSRGRELLFVVHLAMRFRQGCPQSNSIKIHTTQFSVQVVFPSHSLTLPHSLSSGLLVCRLSPIFSFLIRLIKYFSVPRWFQRRCQLAPHLSSFALASSHISSSSFLQFVLFLTLPFRSAKHASKKLLLAHSKFMATPFQGVLP